LTACFGSSSKLSTLGFSANSFLEAISTYACSVVIIYYGRLVQVIICELIRVCPGVEGAIGERGDGKTDDVACRCEEGGFKEGVFEGCGVCVDGREEGGGEEGSDENEDGEQ
jgi:hypothetical protein